MSGTKLTQSSPFLLLLLLGYCLAVTEGELRCYCNESGCVSTSYMCKSSIGQCYTAVEVRGEVTHQTHGCLDSLPEEHYALCRLGHDVRGGTSSPGNAPVAAPLLLCCTEQMCNYIRDDYDISIILTPKHNVTLAGGNPPATEDNSIYSKNQQDDRDLWFKAAVIAVPIAGGFILVLLVLLAVRMLKTDSRHHRRLLQIRRERSLTKAHMCITEYFVGPGAKQQCSLFSEKPSQTCPQLYSDLLGPRADSSMYKPLHEVYKQNLNHALHGEAADTPTNFPSARGGAYAHSNTGSSCRHSNSSLPCSSCHSDASGHSRSTAGDAYAKAHTGGTHNAPKPCSFYATPLDLRAAPKGPPCLGSGRDVTVKLDRSGHVQPVLVVSPAGQCPQPHTAAAGWDKVYAKGVPAIV